MIGGWQLVVVCCDAMCVVYCLLSCVCLVLCVAPLSVFFSLRVFFYSMWFV